MNRIFLRATLTGGFVLPVVFGGHPVIATELQAAASVVDITPTRLPVIVNGGFLERESARVIDPLHVRTVVLSDTKTTLSISVVDSCMLPRDVCDRIKHLAHQKTGIPVDRQLISATHTHSAPSAMDFCLGSRQDKAYTAFLIPRVADSIAQAHARLVPAQAGWTSAHAPDHTHCRRWIRRPDRVGRDPFGEQTVRAMMHPGYQNPDYLGPAGPVDDELSVLSLRTTNGVPIALLSNFSMHYFGVGKDISSDYWGTFSRVLEKKVGTASPTAPANAPPFVVLMSQGTSGDLHWMDYSKPRQPSTPTAYAEGLADIAYGALSKITYKEKVDLAMAESHLTLGRRLPDAERLAWARKLNTERGERRPRNRSEVYAEQAEWIHAHPKEKLVLQAIRIGDLAITGIPNEVYGITGLKLKAQSPLAATFNMSLANGAAGYIPPPEQHALGGYTTWPARTAGLVENAEPQIVEHLLQLLEQVAHAPRRPLTHDLYPESIRNHIRQVTPTGE